MRLKAEWVVRHAQEVSEQRRIGEGEAQRLPVQPKLERRSLREVTERTQTRIRGANL